MSLRERILLAELEKRKRGTVVEGSPDDNLRKYCPQVPTEKQREFLACGAEEALFGGAAGPGKSSALLMAALQYVHVPGYSALILRRTFTDLALPGAIMTRAVEWLAGKEGVQWNDQKKTFLFSNGARISFGYLDSAQAHYRYQGSEIQFLGFDELTQFVETQYLYLRSRLRRNLGADVPLRVRSASNPGGIGHDWVFSRFVDPTSKSDRVFVPAKMEDNPHLDREAYRKTLENLDPITRAQLERGEWVRDSGGQMYLFDTARNTTDDYVQPDYYVLGIDLGASERTPSTAFAILGFYKYQPELVVLESYKLAGLTPTSIAQEIQKIQARYRLDKIVADAGALGKGYVEEFRQRWALPVEAAQKTNRLAYIKLLNGDLSRGVIKIYKNSCNELVDELLSIQWNEAGTDSAPGSQDHCADAMLYGWREGRHWLSKEEPKEPERDTPEWFQKMRDADFKRAQERAKRARTPFFLR